MTFAEYFILGLFVFLGLFSVISASFNFDWFFQTNGAMTFVKWMGRTGARLFYICLGLALILCGILGFINWK